ncbi:MAG: acetyl-CoA carboxylase carboxyltransferase subunit [Rickettsiales bacterium]|nr:acetyl-CoA carboxylase carboxyltransferase subunit [Rickettsiales bacterium]|tara:strand:+ start:591 stop:2201 length:1611 start_codon:yes stop_codon:yes gene_type:complete
MAVIDSQIDPRSEDFRVNREAMLKLVSAYRDLEQNVRALGEKKRAKFEKRGQLMPRERVDAVLDPGAPFLELSSLAGLQMHDDAGGDKAMGGGNIVGIGFVAGARCLVVASDSAIKGGTTSPMGLKKTLRAQQVALENKLPVVSLVESGGANLAYQSELFVEGGKVFCNMARLSAAGIPQFTVVHGSSTAGGAYIPGLSDYVVLVEGRAKVFLAGPPLVKAAIGEDATDEELGGAEMHATVSGLGEYLAGDDAHALGVVRDLIGKLPWQRPSQTSDYRPPRYDVEELCGIVPVNTRHPYDVREVIARIVDDSDFLEFKPGFGSDTVCGHAAIEGWPVGIVANAGPIQPEGSSKAGQFIQLCCQVGVPIIYLQNTTGYMVGREAEQKGAIKHGAKMIQAVANASVPQLTVILGGGYGAGNYGMCGRSFDPRFIFAWPNAQVAVMGGEQAAKVMEIITRAKFERMGMNLEEEALAYMAGELRSKLDAEAGALFGTARIWDDGLIDPRDTRRVLAFALATAMEAESRPLRANSFGVARF